MTISATSTLAEVFTAAGAKWTPSTTDLDAWATAKPATGDTDTVTDVGLFGIDLTPFLDSCAVATDNCDVTTYDGYNGWGIGVCWSKGAGTIASGDFDQTFIVDSLDFLQVEWDTTTNVIDLYAVASAYTPAADLAAASLTIDADGTEDPFAAWWAVAGKVADNEQVAVSFIKEGDTDF